MCRVQFYQNPAGYAIYNQSDLNLDIIIKIWLWAIFVQSSIFVCFLKLEQSSPWHQELSMREKKMLDGFISAIKRAGLKASYFILIMVCSKLVEKNLHNLKPLTLLISVLFTFINLATLFLLQQMLITNMVKVYILPSTCSSFHIILFSSQIMYFVFHLRPENISLWYGLKLSMQLSSNIYSILMKS